MSRSTKEVRKLGLGGLTALTFSMMVGSGIFNIPQNVAAGAGLAANMVAWVVTAVIMLALTFTFKNLSVNRPELNGGIYEYASAGFGHYMGFNMAWGYWICVCFANVAYAVMLNDSFGAFFPALLKHEWEMIVFGSVLIWSMFLLVSNGLKTAKQINNVMTVIKILPMILIIILLAVCVHENVYADAWPGFKGAGDLWEQVRSSMMVTLWCFIGIEGAVMMSARARKPKDVGRAGVIGFMSAWTLYVVISVLSFGIMSRHRLDLLGDPSAAYLLKDSSGNFGYWFVIVSVIISLLGSWVSWTLVCAQVPMEAAHVHIFPKKFEKLNRHKMPGFGLMVSSIFMTLSLCIVALADDVYMAALNITGMMILPCYLFSGLYLLKLGLKTRPNRWRWILIGLVCVLGCGWMLYSAGKTLIATSLFYIIGAMFYIQSGREKNSYYNTKLPWWKSWHHYFTWWELLIFLALLGCAVYSVIAFVNGWMVVF